MHRPFTIAFLVMFMAATTSYASPTIPDDVRAYVKGLVEEKICTGIVVGVVDENGTTFFAQGQTKSNGGQPVDEKTLFEIGSISKVFTAILLCDQVASGKVALDDPISKFVPAGVTIPSHGDQPITLRTLSTHRSGLPRMPDNFDPADGENPYADYTEQRLFEFLSHHALRRDVGAQYEYSNLATGLLGQLLSRISGTPYESLLRDRISRPLGLADTCITVKAKDAARFAEGYSGGLKQSHWDFDAIAGAGAIRSTASDMLRFLAFNLGLMHCEIDETLQAAQAPRSDAGSADLDVALGWHVWKKYDAEILWHNGGTAGFHSFCGFRKDKKLGVVVLANDSYNIDAIGLRLLEPKFELKALRRSVRVDPKVLDRYVGWYLLAQSIRLQVTREGDALSVQLTGQPAVPVYPVAEDRFVCRVVEAEIEFTRDPDGVPTAAILHQGGRDQRFERAPADFVPPTPPKEVTVDAKVLQAYVGQYRLAPGVDFDVTLKRSQLMVRLTGQPSFPVFAESQTEFFYKVVDATLTFVKDDTGKVVALILHQHGMDQRAERIE
ncbi:MAG: serine hydrolase [Phycisphaerales bacterium]|nr:serine hydrolase [Phycisphaerales bacterium]MCB9864452.1 serine hydrolase [Phycisphaerales bacterium]